EKKVQDYLRDSEALEDYWQRPLTAEQLQAEMERMAKHTRQPEVLREIFEALGDDPYVIAECLARSALSERLLTNFYAHDQRFHGDLRQRAQADLRVHHSVRQMKQTAGKYSEIEWARSDSSQDELTRSTEAGVRMDSREWDETLQKLAAIFGDARGVAADAPATPKPRKGGSPARGALQTQIKTGVLSPLQEDEGRYYTTAVLNKAEDRLKIATLEWRKEPLESWRARAVNQMPKVTAAMSANYTLPTISDGATGCADNTWTATSTTSLNAPAGRDDHTAVWTGSEMIVWGGQDSTGYSNSGAKYDSITDSWTATSTTNVPDRRFSHTAVWTGSEMIVWGGRDNARWFNTGGR